MVDSALMPAKSNWLSSEAEILRRIVGGKSTFANTIHFLLDAAFPYPEQAFERPERNVNKMGKNQALGLLRDGFPFAGLIHISIPERLPKDLLWPVKNLTGKILPNGKPEEQESVVLIDPFPILSGQRQLGRLKRIELPQDIGYNAISLSLSRDGQEFIGNTLGDDRRALKNSSVSEELIASIANFAKFHPEAFCRVSRK